MAAVSTFYSLVFVLIAFSLVSASNTWCNRYSSSCDPGYVCCNNECVYGSNCFYRACTFDSDCSSYESCCGDTCKDGSDCSGDSCSTDSDCGFQFCCYGSCSYNSDCYTGVIVGSVFGGLIVISMIPLCIFYACRRRQTINRPGRVILGRGITATTRNSPQANPPYPGQMPPSYQQGHPYYSPPQYEQHQTAIPRPYNPGTTVASDQPPPYSAATQAKSGGVYAPQTSYGAVKPAPSAPSV